MSMERQSEVARWGFSGVALAVFLLFHPLGQIFCAEKSGKGLTEKIAKSDSPLHIASDRMEVMQKERMILFEGHVVIEQDDLSIKANRMKVFAAPAGKEKGKDADSQTAMMEKIDRIEVEGNVRISQQDKLATSDKAVYYHQEQKIVLMGRPMVAQGKDKVQGRLITLYIAQGRSVVEGGEEAPVQAILHPARKEASP
ncbi:MAG: lipopolysaccharide transport periplasmic protein LptA [Deltaproteobacteria bacterium]|nr:lipopolysaccharide transport periplasmic protein LptA [Deltaproteobacteria bacterium]